MSAQVKKRFEELFTYFKGDRIAMERLKHLKDDVNVMRHALAEAERKEMDALQIKELARLRADKAEQIAEAAMADAQRLGDQVKALECRLEMLTAPKPTAENDAGKVAACELTSVIKGLVRLLPDCPAPLPMSSMNMIKNSFRRVYDRDSLAAGWTRNSLYVLGASVATLAFFHGDVVIVASETSRDQKYSEKGGGWRTALFHWLVKNNINCGSPEEQKKEMALLGLDSNIKHYHPLLRS